MTSDTTNPLPSFSVVVEWDNARSADAACVQSMLTSLLEEIHSLRNQESEKPEVLIVYDSKVTTHGSIQTIVDACLGSSAAFADVQVIGTEGLRYYEMKNTGAKRAKGGIVVFVDSDVIPEPGWLEALLIPFQRPEVSVVGGRTHGRQNTLYEKAFALFWFAEPRLETGYLRPAPFLHANNMAIRRALFLKYRFPRMPLFRGQCYALCQSLKQDDVTIFLHEGARVSHPAPGGLSGFVCNAFRQGHDEVIKAKTADSHGSDDFQNRFIVLHRALPNTVRRIWVRRNEVGIGVAGALVVTGIAAAYLVVIAIGRLLALLDPRLVRRIVDG